MKKEKKIKGNQKISLERIYRLFELAEQIKDEKLKKRYLQLAKKIGEKTNTKIPKELKKKYCKKCFTMNVEEKKEGSFLVIKCKECGHSKKFNAKE